LWLTVPGTLGVIVYSLIRLVGGRDTLDNISFDVDELSQLDKTEQAQRLEEAARRIDEVQRAAADDTDLLQWVKRQRQYLVDMQHLIYEC
jgi:DNA-binding SARP family transcriptional activator